MSSPQDKNSASSPNIELLKFQDDFVEFQGSCAFLCDAIIALTTAELVMDKASVHGLHRYAGEVKLRAQELKEQLQEFRR